MGSGVIETLPPAAFFAQYPGGGAGMDILAHSLPMATSEIPQILASFVLGSRHTKACNSVRVMEVGFWAVMVKVQS
jgi:hypothetical protein